MILINVFEIIGTIAFAISGAISVSYTHLAYMSRESFIRSLETGYTWFYSRERDCLWNKGETSGNFQKIIKIFTDCDNDALVFLVEQKGAACHTGNKSCFFNEVQ